MARKPRIHVSGGLHHVMLRGNGGQAIFSDDADRQGFCALVAEGVGRDLGSGLRSCITPV